MRASKIDSEIRCKKRKYEFKKDNREKTFKIIVKDFRFGFGS